MASQQEHHIVFIGSPLQLTNSLTFPHKITTIPPLSPGVPLPEVAQSATIVLTPAATLTYELLTTNFPHLQCIISMGTGYDNISLPACRERGLTLCNTPSQNIPAVSEHAFALLGALKRRIVPLHQVVARGEGWASMREVLVHYGAALPRENSEEVLAVVGYGSLGTAVEKIAIALGMKVIIAERKGETKVREGRVSFTDAMKQATVIMLTAPLSESTREMISTPEFEMMDPSTYLINVGRGGLVNEAALAKALKEKTIGGAATDVFQTEPADKSNCPLLAEDLPNLVLTPHVAWYTGATMKKLSDRVREGLEGFAKGEPRNVIYQGKL